MHGDLENIDDLIAKVIANEASPEEAGTMEAWLDAEPKNRAYYEESKKLFATIDALKNNAEVNVNAAWRKMDERILSRDTKVIPLFSRRSLIRAAASVILLLGFGFLMYR